MKRLIKIVSSTEYSYLPVRVDDLDVKIIENREDIAIMEKL